METDYVGDAIRRARTRLQLSEAECALAAGLTPMSYDDVETYSDEFFDNISLGSARRICHRLGLNLVDLTAQYFNSETKFDLPVGDGEFYFRHDLISEARTRKGMSPVDLGDAIGFEAIAIEQIERTPDFIESMPIHAIVDIALALDLDPGRLVCNTVGGASGKPETR